MQMEILPFPFEMLKCKTKAETDDFSYWKITTATVFSVFFNFSFVNIIYGELLIFKKTIQFLLFTLPHPHTTVFNVCFPAHTQTNKIYISSLSLFPLSYKSSWCMVLHQMEYFFFVGSSLFLFFVSFTFMSFFGKNQRAFIHTKIHVRIWNKRHSESFS